MNLAASESVLYISSQVGSPIKSCKDLEYAQVTSRTSLRSLRSGNLAGSSSYLAGSRLIVDSKVLQPYDDSDELDEGLPLPDGGYAWVVLGCAFVLQIISGGILLGVGVFTVEFIESFGADRDVVAWIGSINAGFTFLAAPLGSILVNRFSYRIAIFIGALIASAGLLFSGFAESILYLYISYGVVTGIGICLVYNLSMIVVGFYFDKRRSLAIGLTVAGTGFGSLIFPPIYRMLIDSLGWRGALIITAGICLHCCIFASLLMPVHYLQKPFRSIRNEDRSKSGSSWTDQFTDITILSESVFIIFFISNVCWATASSTFYVLLPDFVINTGLSKNDGAWLVSTAGACSTIGRGVTAVFMNNFKGVDRLHVYSLPAIISGTAMSLFPVDTSFVVFVVLCVVFGTFYGAMVTAMPVLSADLFGLEKLTSAFCFLMIANGIGFLLGSPFAGWLFTITTNYTVAFVVNGVFLALTGFVMYTLPCIKKLKRHCCHQAPMTVAVETKVTQNGVSMETKTTITVPGSSTLGDLQR